ncbi:MAG: C1 family peptidase [Candidatus Diapherotrites archaeon]
MKSTKLFVIIFLLAFGYFIPFVAALPSNFDWRNHDGYNWMTSVKNQGDCGSCWAFSTVGSVEAVYNIRKNNYNLDLDLAEEEIVSDCLLDSDCCVGWISSALNYIKNNGITDETHFSYVDNSCSCSGGNCTCTYSGPDRCSNRTCGDKIGGGLNYKISNTSSVPAYTETIKQYLIEKGPLSVCMGWGNHGGYWDGDIYRCTNDEGTDHCVVLVGYNADEYYWIAKNSYGSSWQDNGYFKVGYGECDIESYARYADVIGCGTTITKNTILTGDLINCPGNGINIGANNITLNCNNLLIDGDNLGYDYGIFLEEREGVTIKNCRIEEFYNGIGLWWENTNHTLIDNTIKNNKYGVIFNDWTNNHNNIRNNEFNGNTQYGAWLQGGAADNTFWNNTFTNNGENAYEYSNNNDWDYSGVGNYWDDFSSNSGYPTEYIIPGPGDGVDHFPEGALLPPGEICNSDSECGSNYCEGSVSNPARCCISEPAGDSWEGGGNSLGCGTDPNANYNDYYCNASGNIQSEITDTKNCDSQDNCSDYCLWDYQDGTDYYFDTSLGECVSKAYESDDDEENCTNCIGESLWNLGGEIELCCGDDSSEFKTTRNCEVDACTSDATDDACCIANTSCVYNSGCYNNGYIGDVDSDTENEECENGIWKLQPPQCGDTITEDTTLTADLLNCSNGGLGIGADNITLDCDNHLIDGTGEFSGIYLYDIDTVTIKNCNIQEFQNGILLLYKSSSNILLDNVVENNEYGLIINNQGSNNTVTGNDFIENSTHGISIGSDSQNNTIWNNDFIDNSVNAYEDSFSNNNNWDYSETGNYWSDFESNEGYPYEYVIAGSGNGIDNFPNTNEYAHLLFPENNTTLGMGSQFFDWTDVPNVTQYELHATKPDLTEESLVVPTNSEVTFGAKFWNTKLEDGLYTWKVRPIFDGIPGKWSGERNITRKTIPELYLPENGAELGLGGQYVDWEAIIGADGYYLYVVRPEGLKYNLYVKKDEFTVPAWFWDPLPLGEYTWKVRTVNSGDFAPYSEAWTFTKTE